MTSNAITRNSLVYVPESPIHHQGDVPRTSEIMDVLTAFQSNMERHLSGVGGKLDNIDARMDALETRQEGLKEQVQALGHGASSQTGDATPSPAGSRGKRKRRTPVGLQVHC